MDTIIKYANRKYYSKNLKRYTNLEEIIHKYILTDQEYVVIDYVTGNDITQESLLHSIASYNLNIPLNVLKALVKTFGVTPMSAKTSSVKITRKPIRAVYKAIPSLYPETLNSIMSKANIELPRGERNAIND